MTCGVNILNLLLLGFDGVPYGWLLDMLSGVCSARLRAEKRPRIFNTIILGF